jgi:flagellar protein FlgJ
MNVSAIQPKVDASHVAMENLAGNKALTEEQKIAEASRQFEAILLRQFLSEAQKPCFKSEFTDESSEAGIYQDMVTNQLADALTRGNGVGLAQTFQKQLTKHHAEDSGVQKISGGETSERGSVSRSTPVETMHALRVTDPRSVHNHTISNE